MTAQGYLSEAEAGFLYEIARNATGPIVEIGSYQGRSTIALALGSRAGHGVPVFAIEPHEQFAGPLGGVFGPADRAAFFRNLLETGVTEIVRLINLSSEIVAPGWRTKIDVLWIDGDHTYEGVRRDVDVWLPHLMPEARLAFHDTDHRELGPWKVVEELLSEGFTHVEELPRISVLKRTID